MPTPVFAGGSVLPTATLLSLCWEPVGLPTLRAAVSLELFCSLLGLGTALSATWLLLLPLLGFAAASLLLDANCLLGLDGVGSNDCFRAAPAALAPCAAGLLTGMTAGCLSFADKAVGEDAIDDEGESSDCELAAPPFAAGKSLPPGLPP